MTLRVGTCLYMAPEVVSNEHYDAATDVYSMSITIWEICHKKLPYFRAPGSNTDIPAHLVYHQTSQGVRPPVVHYKDEPLTLLYQRGWETDPINRAKVCEFLNVKRVDEPLLEKAEEQVDVTNLALPVVGSCSHKLVEDLARLPKENYEIAIEDVSEGMTKYGKLTKVANLNFYCDPTLSMNIIFSIEFDTTGERFAVAGFNRKIKIFNFDNFFKNQTKQHFPLTQLHCQAAISSTSWNPVQNEILASSDYDGHVSLWDVEAGRIVKSFHEYEKSCRTVSFNNVEPKLMASGNHKVYHYDIRNVEKPLAVFRGHRKAVSNVRFLSNTTIVSASTDSSLRVWDTVEGRCLKVLKGHTNEKNFVGLSSNGDHILCGSENGRVFLYYKGLSEPIASYVLGKDGSTNDDDAEGFVSSVCWKKGTNYALAANSHGKVHLLEAK